MKTKIHAIIAASVAASITTVIVIAMQQPAPLTKVSPVAVPPANSSAPSSPQELTSFALTSPIEPESKVAAFERAEQANDFVAMAELVESCATAVPPDWHRTSPLAQSGQVPQEILDTLHEDKDCNALRLRLPPDTIGANWAWDLYAQGAIAGDPIAQLKLLAIDPQANKEAYKEMIDSMLPSRDYRVLYQAGYYYANFPDADDPLLSQAYLYAGCMRDPKCDPLAHVQSLEQEFLPREVQEIMEKFN